MTTIQGPDWDVPVVGLPEGTKEAGQRVDFRNKQFDLLIETKGTRLAWTRACPCPCDSDNTQTDQPSVNCSLCDGTGWIYFGPTDAYEAEEIGDLTDLQQKIIDDSGAAIIRGVLLGISSENQPFELKLQRWLQGMSEVTVRPGNRIAYYDKLVAFDATLPFAQLVKVDGSVLPLRYPAVLVNLVRDETTSYKNGTHFDVSAEGVVTWRTAHQPADGTRVAVHYVIHPTWLIVTHPHATRLTIIKKKQQVVTTPRGTPTDLPIQAAVKLDFVP
jgi:hypothetical protein